MSQTRRAAALTLAVLALAPGEAAAGPRSDASTALAAVDRLTAAGRLSEAEAKRLRIVLRRARLELLLLPGARGAELAAVLRQVARRAPSAGPARLRALTATLDENASYLGVNPVPVPRAYAHDEDGVVFRAFPGVGLQFHPLATFARLNSLVTSGDRFGAARLASSVLRLGSRREGGLVWSYEFPFGGGEPPWTSGMAQAVAAQALARAAAKLGAPALLGPARRAYEAVPGALVRTTAGPWVRLYSFSDLVVLNAQLQTAISLAEYGRLAADGRAAALAVELRTAAAELLPRFDTGYWSRYTLVGESSLGYHVYVVRLLEKLAAATGLDFWRRAASRFGRYTEEAPKLESRRAVPVLYPRPADGWRDRAVIRFWLSKRSEVTARLGDERRTLSLGQGVHTLRWSPPERGEGDYPVRVAAVDLAGNRSAVRLPDLRVRVDRAPPRVDADLAGRRLSWHVRDRGTPVLEISLHLRREGRLRVRDLGSRPHRGSVVLRLPRRAWNASLVVEDVSGNRTHVRLGLLGGPGGRLTLAPTIR
jgi:D-glucuronyl C5-epimerase C-terminus